MIFVRRKNASYTVLIMAMFVSLQLLLLQLLCFVPSGTPVVEAVKLPAAAEGASASKLRSLGENAMVAGKYDEAAQLYKKVIQMEPQVSLLLFCGCEIT